jgi:hypothetical protein
MTRVLVELSSNKMVCISKSRRRVTSRNAVLDWLYRIAKSLKKLENRLKHRQIEITFFLSFVDASSPGKWRMEWPGCSAGRLCSPSPFIVIYAMKGMKECEATAKRWTVYDQRTTNCHIKLSCYVLLLLPPKTPIIVTSSYHVMYYCSCLQKLSHQISPNTILTLTLTLVSSYLMSFWMEGHCPSYQWGICRTSTKYISVSTGY